MDLRRGAVANIFLSPAIKWRRNTGADKGTVQVRNSQHFMDSRAKNTVIPLGHVTYTPPNDMYINLMLEMLRSTRLDPVCLCLSYFRPFLPFLPSVPTRALRHTHTHHLIRCRRRNISAFGCMSIRFRFAEATHLTWSAIRVQK